MVSKLAFTFDEDKVLAEFMSKHPTLYDLSHLEYITDQETAEKLWKELSEILKKSGEYHLTSDFYQLDNVQRETQQTGRGQCIIIIIIRENDSFYKLYRKNTFAFVRIVKKKYKSLRP